MSYIKNNIPLSKMTRLLKGTASSAELGEAMGVCSATARSKMRNPETLTLGDLIKISRRLHIPKAELLEAMNW